MTSREPKGQPTGGRFVAATHAPDAVKLNGIDRKALLATPAAVYSDDEDEGGRPPIPWNGTDDTPMIASGTAPWIELDRGETLDLRFALDEIGYKKTPNGCPDCDAGSLVPGVVISGEDTIERCDTCETFPGDLEAAKYVADLIGGGEVWYIPAD